MAQQLDAIPPSSGNTGEYVKSPDSNVIAGGTGYASSPIEGGVSMPGLLRGWDLWLVRGVAGLVVLVVIFILGWVVQAQGAISTLQTKVDNLTQIKDETSKALDKLRDEFQDILLEHYLRARQEGSASTSVPISE